MKQVVCFGELLIDMIAMNPGNLVEAEGFLKKFGGAPANTASGLAKLGLPVSFIGKVGQDPFGYFLKRELDTYKVNTKKLVMSETGTTTLALVSLTKQGDRDFFFIRGVHDKILPSEVELPKNTGIFHFGSLTQTTVQASKATDKLISQAIKAGAILSYDPNIREFLWGDLKRAKLVILDTAKKVNILKVNEEEAELLSGIKNPQRAAEKLFRDNLDILIITLANKGCYYKTKKYEGLIPTIKVKVVDTTGAGDAFNAGLISGLYEAKKRASELSKIELEKILKRAVIIGTLTTTKKGAVTAFPNKNEITKYLK
ncbi:carbohydrate kinase [Patescibacteria group bacterium]|nr:carbohydrate kinase [Patescibacteria group bacterium]MBU1499647.1 carbohydrate kinase [Patescibacteria group bacterium]